jgi:hypothetical protein
MADPARERPSQHRSREGRRSLCTFAKPANHRFDGALGSPSVRFASRN